MDPITLVQAANLAKRRPPSSRRHDRLADVSALPGVGELSPSSPPEMNLDRGEVAEAFEELTESFRRTTR
jgi:hypothetical protein